MAFIRMTSPHAHAGKSTAQLMQQVLWACLPGLIALTYFFGPGTLVNLVMAGTSALIFEAGILKCRQKPIAFYLKDGSALVTATLLALALPPYAPWWLVVIGVFFAIVVAKHLYGGLGFNPFNPAMVGYVVLLISFPLQMSQWTTPHTLALQDPALPGINQALQKIFLGQPLDGFSSATPLDVMRQAKGLTLDNIYQQTPIFNQAWRAGAGWEWVNIGFLLGGLYLLGRRVFSWHAPVGMLLSLGFMAVLFYDSGSSNSGGSPMFHWLSGGTLLGAFFIVTDPVTSAASPKGRLIYGIGIGLLIYAIRTWGNYPDAVAFAVLIMNFAAPFIDYYTVPRTYGHAQATSAIRKRP